jgi:gamma-glutamyltranspeptidase/glutathione hydrolase
MKGMVVAPQPQAVEGGVHVLKEGGNAVDAAVVTAFLQGVVSPLSCGIGGFGQMLVYMDGEKKVIDFHAKAGSKVTPDMWKDIVEAERRDDMVYLIEGDVNEIGYQSIMIPGTVLGLHEALTRYGTLSWKEAIQPAIRLASEGWMVTRVLGRPAVPPIREGSLDKLAYSPDGRRIYLRNGTPLKPGEFIVNKDLAETMTTLAEGGPDIFYRGELAEKMIDDIDRHGGFVTLKDLNDYSVNIYEPISTTYRGYTVSSIDFPGGGLTNIELLNILEGYDLNEFDWSGMGSDIAEYIRLLAMAMRAAEVDRVTHGADPAFVDVPRELFTSKVNAAEWRKRIDSGERIIVPKWQPEEGPSTTHLTAMDRDGNAVSLTHTLASGSGVITPGLGFIYNNSMQKCTPFPGRPNSIAPGKSRLTQMSPTMVLEDDELYMVLGAPGGGKICSAIVQTIINVLDHSMSIFEAVAAPRIHCIHTNIIDVSARIPNYICKELEQMGEVIVKHPTSYGPFANVHAILVDKMRDRLRGGSDPRSGGCTLSE